MERIEQLPLFDDFISFVDKVMPYIETSSEAKILIYICEYAHFTPTHISVDEFVRATGLSETSVLRGLRSAQNHGLITIIVDETDKSLIKKYYCLRQANHPITTTISHRREKPVKVLRARQGYVYLLQSPSGYYKIGCSRNPQNRLKTFGVKLPFEVEYICLIKTTNMIELERSFHQHFATKRVNGEWFKLDAEDVEYIKRFSYDYTNE